MADSRAQDPRLYFRLHEGYPDSPKIAKVGGDAGWLDICAIAYCARNLTDGLIPKGMVPRLSDRSEPQALACLLLDVGRWHEAGHDCDTCPQPGANEYVVHDYLEHQRSAAEVADLRRKRSEAGAKGGRTRANRQALAKQTLEQTASKVQPETETETEEVTPLRSRATTKKATRVPDPFPLDEVLKSWFNENCAGLDGPGEHEKFMDYWRGAPGVKGRKDDWPATWRNWMRTARERTTGSAPTRATTPSQPRRLHVQ